MLAIEAGGAADRASGDRRLAQAVRDWKGRCNARGLKAGGAWSAGESARGCRRGDSGRAGIRSAGLGPFITPIGQDRHDQQQQTQHDDGAAAAAPAMAFGVMGSLRHGGQAPSGRVRAARP